MGLKTLVKERLRSRYGKAFGYEGPQEIPVLCVDFMQFVKGTIPDYIETEEQLINFFFYKILDLTDSSDHLVICFDKRSPEVKKMVEYKDRKEVRCALCKAREPLPHGKTVKGPMYFDPACEKRCEQLQLFHYEEGPHLPHGGGKLKFKGSEWMRFAMDSKNLRCELYPRIANKFLGCTLKPGKSIYLNGLPFKNKTIFEWRHDATVVGDRGIREERVVLDYWSYDELPLEEKFESFCQTIIIRGNDKFIEPTMYNTIEEADNAIFWFLTHFPQCYRQMVYINDGDALPIGLLWAYEYYIAPKTHSHELWVCLPSKSRKFDTPKFEYVNMALFCELVQESVEFKAAGVQCPVATLVFLIILSETDFFKDYCKNIVVIREWHEDQEKREKQTNGIWDTFYERLSVYSHMVQYYKGESSLKNQKRIVIDRDLFRIFTKACYHNAYAEKASKKLKLKKEAVDDNHIRIYCTKSMNKLENHPPHEDIMDRQCGQIDWNINYWLNATRNIHIDPFEKDANGLPYYGYEKDKGIVDVVARKQKTVDEVHKKHFWKRKQKLQDDYKGIPEKRKRDALEILKGN